MKTKVLVIAMVFCGLFLGATTVVAAPIETQAPDTDILMLIFPVEFVKAVLGLVVLIVLDLVLGVSVAIQQKVFEWAKLADFYRTKVLPNVLGWAVLDILLRVAANYQLPIVEQMQPLGSAALYGVVLAALLGQVVAKVGQLRGER